MWQVIGQNRAVSLLKSSLEKGALAHAYLLIGPHHVGKMTLAMDLARAINCGAATPPCGECSTCLKISSGKHPDVEVITISGGQDISEDSVQTEISIERIRQLQHSASLPPFEARYKVFIIEGAELLSNEAANCLLKTLEEPADKVIFALVTAREELLPATVVSRCQRLELLPLPPDEMEKALGEHWDIEQRKARLLARLSRGCLGQALEYSQDESLLKERSDRIEQMLKVIGSEYYEERLDYAARLSSQFNKDRRAAIKNLDMWLDWWHDLLLVKIGVPEAITSTDYQAVLERQAEYYDLNDIREFISAAQAAFLQLKQNANSQLVFEVLMLGIPERRL
ncbi:MAG: AAA family ATPase [Dehalococcoidales bacterium]